MNTYSCQLKDEDHKTTFQMIGQEKQSQQWHFFTFCFATRKDSKLSHVGISTLHFSGATLMKILQLQL